MHFRVFASQTVPSGIAKRVGVKERINLPSLKVAVHISCRGKHSWIKISLRWRWGRGLNFIPVKNKMNQTSTCSLCFYYSESEASGAEGLRTS